METFNVKSVNYDKKIEILEHIFSNMRMKQQGLVRSGYLLGGDPGVGKTSFIRDMAVLIGMELIVIEIPHLVEEHIINIPFIVFNPANEKEQSLNAKFTGADFDVQLAKSNLFMKISDAKKVPDAQHLKNIYKSEEMSKIWEGLGGDKDKIPDEIKKIRSNFDCILFLDEYFRETSTNIRNMLRGVLNGNIGSHDIPKNVYVIYASNLDDEGVEGIPLNKEFRLIDFEAPNKEEWFGYLVSKFNKDEKVKLDDKIIQKFWKLLEEEHLSHKDAEADVRASPRRWEQLLLYINSSLPAKSQKEAQALMTNVKHNFRNYLTGAHHALADKVLKAVSELIKDTSDISVGVSEISKDTEWRDTLKHQIEQKIKQGKHRKYIPVVSGLPGIGKTQHMTKVALELNLVLVDIKVEGMSPEEVIGVPLSKTTGAGKTTDIEVKFSKPPLYTKIMKLCTEGEKHFKERLEQNFSAAEAKDRYEKFKKSDYKYLIFFDELNRASVKVFNSLRRVLLEKSFGDGNDLPEGSVLVAAINPSDKANVTELTHHMRDVVDIIPASVSWSKFEAEHLDKIEIEDLKEPESTEVVKEVFVKFVDKFRVKGTHALPEADPQFYLNIGTTPIYVSPREYSDLFVSTVDEFDRVLHRNMGKFNEDEEDAAKIDGVLREALYKSFSHTLNAIFKKHEVDSPEFMKDLHQWFKSSDDINVGDVFKKKVQVVDFEQIVEPVFNDPKKDLYDDIEFIAYLNNVDHLKFKEDLQEFITKKLESDEKNELGVLRKKDTPKKTLVKEKIKYEKEEVTKLEHFVREIVHAIKVHKLPNDMYEMIKIALRKCMSDIKNDDWMEDFLAFNSAVAKLIKDI